MTSTKTEQSGPITTIYYDVKNGWEQWFLLVSDVHFDSIYCNREKLQADFEEAKRRKARIMIFGDWFDAMQGRYDKRRAPSELRSEYLVDDYYDRVVLDSAEWLAPYAKYIDIIADGNHECSVLQHANTNLPGNLVHDLNVTHKVNIHHGGYGGWVRLMINLSGGEDTGPRKSIKMKYFHGSGGEAPVTRGVIQTNRQAVYLPDADIVVNGHSHNNYIVPITRERLSNKGQQYFDNQYHIRIPGYKQAYGDGTAGWEVTRGGVPKPIGSILLRLKYVNVNDGRRIIHVYPSEELISPPEPVSVDATAVYDGPVYDDDGEGY